MVGVFDPWPNKYYFFHTNPVLQVIPAPAAEPAQEFEVIEEDPPDDMDLGDDPGAVRWAEVRNVPLNQNRILQDPEYLRGRHQNMILLSKEVKCYK